MATVFVYRANWYTDGRSEPVVAKASRAWVESYISLDELCSRFGGYVVWRGPAQPTDEMPAEALGVWGRRNVSRFKRVLRERGAEFQVVKGKGPDQALKMQATA
jgi:hypothetical protein